MAEAAEFLRAGEYVLAEKKLIEVISHQPKKVDAYEALGNVYIHAKQYGQARETFQFALRLSPDDASVYMSLAELGMLEGNPAAACEQVRQSVEKRPHNPKYIDLYIESAIGAGLVEDAKKGIELLKTAKKQGNKIVTGIGMLAFQAAIGFENWFHHKAEIDSELLEFLTHMVRA